MSILTLSIDQTLMIADHVTVTILEIDGSQICIEMNAPKRYQWIQRRRATRRSKRQKLSLVSLIGDCFY